MSNVGGARRREPGQCAAMDAADPARREDRDPGGVRRDHRGRDGRGRPAAVGQRGGEARPRGLADRAGGRRRQGLERRPRPARRAAARRGSRPWPGPRRPPGPPPPRRRRDLEVLRVRQAVADQGRFEGDDRPALGQGRRDLRVHERGGRAMRRRRLMPSDSSARGVVSWRAAAPCPASAARWSAAAGDDPAARAANQPTRNPASNASPGAGGVDRGDGRRSRPRSAGCGPRPGQDAGALRAALDDRDRREVEQAVLRVAAEERVRLGRGGEDDVRACRPDQGACRPPATLEERPDRGQVDADGSARGPPELDRPPAGVAQRNAEQRVDRQVHGGGPREPVRPAGRPAPAGPRRRGRPRTSAGRRAPRRPRSGPSARRRPATIRGVTPSTRRASTSARPAASRPTAEMRLDRAPRRASQRAVFAADPPWTRVTRPGTSVPLSRCRSGTRTTSSIRSPRTTMRGPASRPRRGRRGREGRRGRDVRKVGTHGG